MANPKKPIQQKKTILFATINGKQDKINHILNINFKIKYHLGHYFVVCFFFYLSNIV